MELETKQNTSIYQQEMDYKKEGYKSPFLLPCVLNV